MLKMQSQVAMEEIMESVVFKTKRYEIGHTEQKLERIWPYEPIGRGRKLQFSRKWMSYPIQILCIGKDQRLVRMHSSNVS